MAEAGSDFGWLFPAKLWEHRAKLRRDRPVLFWGSVVILVLVGGLVVWSVIERIR